MKYQAPYGSVDPNAGYVDKDVPGAVVGSKVPRQAVEEGQRELQAIIVAAGMVPSHVDLAQVVKAIQSQAFNYAAAGGTANAITAAFTPALVGHLEGMPLRVKIATTNTGPATLNGKAIRSLSGGALKAGDMLAGMIAEFFYVQSSDTYVYTSIPQGVGPYTFGPQYKITASQTWNRPAGVRALMLEGVAGGGAGGGATVTTSGNLSVGAGGGAGGYFRLLLVAPAASYTVTIGAGGAPVSNGAGGAGTSTSWGGVATALGGSFGNLLGSGNGSNSAVSGPGGTASGGDIVGTGMGGLRGIRLGGTNGYGGAGGSSNFGGGGYSLGIDGNGPDGGGYGAGGGGGLSFNGSGPFAGGAGSPGVIVVQELY